MDDELEQMFMHNKPSSRKRKIQKLKSCLVPGELGENPTLTPRVINAYLKKKILENDFNLNSVKFTLSVLRDYWFRKTGQRFHQYECNDAFNLAKNRQAELELKKKESDTQVNKKLAYSLEDILKLSEHLIRHPFHRSCLLLRCFTSSRMSTLQPLTFADFTFQEIEELNGTKIPCIGLVSEFIESNAYERKGVVYFTRNKDYRICPVTALAIELIRRFFEIAPVRGARIVSINYNTHKDFLNRKHNELEIGIGNILHAARRFAANTMTSYGVPIDESRTQGLWKANSDVFSSHDITKPPTKAIKALAGFKLDEVYKIERDTLEPSMELKRRHCFKWLKDNDLLFNFLAKSFLQDAVHFESIQTPEMKDDPDFKSFSLALLEQRSTDLETERREAVEVFIEREVERRLEDMIHRRRSKKVRDSINRTYNPNLGIYMDRSLSNVESIIREYYIGVQDHQSIRNLNETFGTSWKKTNNREAALYSYRKPIYDFLEELLTKKHRGKIGSALNEAIELVRGENISSFRDKLLSGEMKITANF
ncbi:hypothetical protein GpartN1_g7135.t1 [Galdieria partita]|uniref:Transcription activator GCR1-like domain-containing protein n=1 Tax=Galdieria partita TaxID=83374 RepID=A0A9C7Q225_9RHOD|nr:hypothetical protein GpartN1_g6839.t1 [Galdieria partita]GJQ15344.1 hypothetical protein GpartN1_g7135.t1 [Galdieria partita]